MCVLYKNCLEPIIQVKKGGFQLVRYKPMAEDTFMFDTPTSRELMTLLKEYHLVRKMNVRRSWKALLDTLVRQI